MLLIKRCLLPILALIFAINSAFSQETILHSVEAHFDVEEDSLRLVTISEPSNLDLQLSVSGKFTIQKIDLSKFIVRSVNPRFSAKFIGGVWASFPEGGMRTSLNFHMFSSPGNLLQATAGHSTYRESAHSNVLVADVSAPINLPDHAFSYDSTSSADSSVVIESTLSISAAASPFWQATWITPSGFCRASNLKVVVDFELEPLPGTTVSEDLPAVAPPTNQLSLEAQNIQFAESDDIPEEVKNLVSPPTLSVTKTEKDKVVVSWPKSFGGWNLHCSNDMMNDSWKDASSDAALSATEYRAIFNISDSPQMFFKLTK